MSDERYFFVTGRGNDQAGIYKLLVERKGIDVETVKFLIRHFAASPPLSRMTVTDSDKRYVIKAICHEHFSEFLAYVSRITGKTFRNHDDKKHFERIT